MKNLVSVLILGLVCAVIGFAVSPRPITVYLPDAGEGSQPFCLSNHTAGDITIPHGPTLHTGQTVKAGVVRDFQWGFTNPAPATDRGDVDCLVIGK